MAEMLVMRRANGDLFTEETAGQLYIPVWSSRTAVARYRERNPELLTYLPVRVDGLLIKRIKMGLVKAQAVTFFLLSDDAPDAYLDQGRPISLDELLPMNNIASSPATAQV